MPRGFLQRDRSAFRTPGEFRAPAVGERQPLTAQVTVHQGHVRTGARDLEGGMGRSFGGDAGEALVPKAETTHARNSPCCCCCCARRSAATTTRSDADALERARGIWNLVTMVRDAGARISWCQFEGNRM